MSTRPLILLMEYGTLYLYLYSPRFVTYYRQIFILTWICMSSRTLGFLFRFRVYSFSDSSALYITVELNTSVDKTGDSKIRPKIVETIAKLNARHSPTLTRPAVPLTACLHPCTKTNKFGCHGSVPWEIKKLVSGWSSAALVLPTLKIWRRSVQCIDFEIIGVTGVVKR